MFKRIFYVLLSIVVAFSAQEAKASHLVGGEIYYDCLGPDPNISGNYQFLLSMKIYRDCHSHGAPFDDPAFMVRFNDQGVSVDTFYMYLDSIKNIPYYIDNPCLIAPPNICVEAGYYSETISIPGGAGDFTISCQRCCRNHTIVNINNPSGTGSTYTTVIKDPVSSDCNSSPRYNDFPPLAICSNYPIGFDHSATDPDNDSLVYEFCTPLDGGSTIDPMPYAGAPPYNKIQWKNAFSKTNPLTANPGLSISSNGFLDGTPTAVGQYVVGICVSEYRNENLLSTTFRDFQFNVANCDPQVVASIMDQQKFCEGYKYRFNNVSNGGSFYKWDFGVEGVQSDTSRLFSPYFTFPDSGVYEVMLIVNPGWPCSDTSVKIFDVRDTLTAFFETPEDQCLEDNEFHFQAAGKFASRAAFQWDFGAAGISNVSKQNPNISFASAGTYPVSLTISQDGCERTYFSSVEVIENPISDFNFEGDSSCIPFEVEFKAVAENVDEPSYSWDFGDGNKGTGSIASHTYHYAGNYDVSLLVENSGKCQDSSLKVKHNAVVALPLPIADFIVDKREVSKFDAEVQFKDASMHSFRNEFYPMQGIQLEGSERTFVFPDTGHYTIMQVSYNKFGCTDTSYKKVFVYDEFHLYIPNAFTPNGDGNNEFFMPVVSGVDVYLFQVFNRWGELIFETNDPTEGWNGKRRGEKSQDGAYVYRVEAEDFLGNGHSYKGSFVLIR